MKKSFLLLCLLPAAVSAESFWASDVWKERDRGFLWYPDPAAKPEKLPDPDLRSFTEASDLKAERLKRLERAVMDPTPEHVASYLEANHFVQEKSALFTDLYRRALWENPGYDFSVKNPAANFAQVKLGEERRTGRSEGLKEIAKDWGLVFFVSESCRFCEMQSPLVKALADEYGFEVLPITLDRPTSHFPDALPDNGISRLLTNGEGLQRWPALFIVNREQSKSYPVGSGILSVEEMAKRIEVLVAIPEGESLFGGSDAK